ncbi:unnamed protein product [Staurois parvus]|uniref:Uncharacterized protein n=1 Tax=Staurois parvus TaxID=386267 RepID=A0ABN9BSF0_9NEOB|nr:unnamed protein product [Staurois parvus]
MISVAPEVPPVSAHQCHVPLPISCLPMSLISASQCHLSVLPISATYQCQSVSHISAH